MTLFTLANTTDPARLIPGAPSGLHVDADGLNSRAENLELLSSVVQRQDVGAWTGLDAEGFHTRRAEIVSTLTAVAQAHRAAAEVLHAHADVVAWGQAQAAEAVELWHSACVASDAWTTATAASTPRFGGPTIVIQPLVAASDPGTSRRRQAEAIVAGAWSQVSRSGQAAAEALDSLSDGLPDGRWHAASFFAGIGDWVKELFVNASLPGVLYKEYEQVRDADSPGDWWQQRLDEVSSQRDTLSHIGDDPNGAWRQVADLDGLDADPARWWGKAAPDIALLGLGGVGAASKAIDALRIARATEGFSATRALGGPALAERVAQLWPGRTVYQEVSGQVGGWNSALHTPRPNAIYIVDDNAVYVTDSLGRVHHTEATWHPTTAADVETKRNRYQQQAAGRDFRLPGDEGGHLLAASGGGAGEGVNLVAMAKKVNVGTESYGAMEAEIRSLAATNPNATIRLEVDLKYVGESVRPSTIAGRYFIDGVEGGEGVFKQ